MKKEMCVDSALRSSKKGLSPKGTLPDSKERLILYKKFAVTFSYPEGDFFVFFPEQKKAKEELQLVYDRLFRKQEFWLDTAEYIVENEFQRVNYLSDIQGFYLAFGLKPEKARPDFLVNELEFMHYLIFKEDYAHKNSLAQAEQKAKICHDAQKKFFHTYLYPAAKKIVEKVILASEGGFYSERAQSLSAFLESEEEFFRRD